jgi:Fuc2NAc and GlcNAc transferase
MIIILLSLLTFLVSCWATYLIYHYALANDLLDQPNERSSHRIPTPRGGGIAIVITFLIVLLGLKQFALISLSYDLLSGLIIASLLVAGIGLWDDLTSIPAHRRLVIHLIAILIVLSRLAQLPPLIFFSISLDHTLLNFIFYTVALAWLLNLYNFMDGLDGLASSEAICVSGSAALLLSIQGNNDWRLVLSLLAVSVTGFLVWNWPTAKIFMGDACSGFLGFILGILALLTSIEGLINVWSWLILLAVFISDATLTLISRIIAGEQWYQAHCSHGYQCYARQLIKQFEKKNVANNLARRHAHQKINVSVIIINIFWLLPLAAIATFYPFWGLVVSIIAYSPLIITLKYFRNLT